MHQLLKKFDPQTDLLALDFDGVVVDSIAECLVVGYNALAIQQGRDERIQRLDELPPATVWEARRIRNFIRHGQDYVFIHFALQQSVAIANQVDFDGFLEKNQSLENEFRRIFYDERARFLQEEPQNWLALNPFYPDMQEFVENYQPPERLFIITTKLRENVEAILQGNGVEFYPDNIYSADQKISKSQIIGQLLAEKQLKPAHFHFIDDQVDTLIRAQSTGVNLYLAGWGYNNAEQVETARKNRLQILTLAEFREKFGR